MPSDDENPRSKMAPDAGADAALSAYAALHRLHLAHDRFLTAASSLLHVSPSERRILWALLDGHLTLTEIARATGYGKATTSTSARSLHDRGFVDRYLDRGVMHYVLEPDAAHRIRSLYEPLLQFVVEETDGADRLTWLTSFVTSSTQLLHGSVLEMEQQPALETLTTSLLAGDAVQVEAILQRQVSNTGDLTATYDITEQAIERIISMVAREEIVETSVVRATSIARRGLERIHQLTRQTRTTDRVAISIRPLGEQRRLCSFIASQVLEREGWEVLLLESMYAPTQLVQLVEQAGARLVVIAAPAPDHVDEVGHMIDHILDHEDAEELHIAIVGRQRHLLNGNRWGERVHVVGNEQLRTLARSLVDSASN